MVNVNFVSLPQLYYLIEREQVPTTTAILLGTDYSKFPVVASAKYIAADVLLVATVAYSGASH